MSGQVVLSWPTILAMGALLSACGQGAPTGLKHGRSAEVTGATGRCIVNGVEMQVVLPAAEAQRLHKSITSGTTVSTSASDPARTYSIVGGVDIAYRDGARDTVTLTTEDVVNASGKWINVDPGAIAALRADIQRLGQPVKK